MKSVKYISWFLGLSMFMFGVLKFVDPFKSWYTIQILQSGLGSIAYVMGIASEIAIGATIILAFLLQKRITAKVLRLVLLGASLAIMVTMIVAIYVHLLPSVPSEVLPLKLKAPIIPAMFLALAIANMWLILRSNQKA
jgi:hypothetical protein